MNTIKKFFNHLIANHAMVFFLSVIVLIVLLGTLLFYLVEGRTFFNAFYFTTITMSTVGYGDMVPLTHGGKIISIIYGFMGAPLFVGLTGIILQSKFQKIVKSSIHEYHKELKEAEKIAQQIKEIHKETQEDTQEEKHLLHKKKHRRKFR